jgi:Spy/CpxP family protein refolding chaperone
MTILFILSSILVAKMLFRWRMHHAWAHGGGCSRRRNRGPIDLGAPDDDSRGYPGRGGSRFMRRWQRWQRDLDASTASAPFGSARAPRGGSGIARAPRADVAGALELNQRQQELFDEVMGRARNWVEPANLAEALAAVGREPYDRAEVEMLVGSVEISDDFEHFHHSLTAEQRAKLREVTSSSTN